MADLSRLSLPELYFLEAVSRTTNAIETNDLAPMVELSVSQTVRRGRQLESQGLVTIEDGGAGRIFRFSLSSEVVRSEVLGELRNRLTASFDPIARSALSAINLTLGQFIELLSVLSDQIQTLLGEQDNSA